MRHTPGPWEVKEVMGQIFVAGKPYEGHPYFNRTTTVEIMSDEYYPTKESDARLIAAAPELLEALKWFCERVEKGEVRSTRTYIRFKELIAKAEAKEHP